MLSDDEGLEVLRDKYRDAAVSGCFNGELPADLLFVRRLFEAVMALIHKRSCSAKLGDQYYPGGMCLPGVRRAFVRVAERVTRNNRLDPAAKRECCEDHRQFLDYNLRFYCSILEKNIEAFSFMRNVFIN